MNILNNRNLHNAIVSLFVCAFFLAPVPYSPLVADAVAGEKVKKVKPPKTKYRPNLSYRPNVSRLTVKYPGRVGVLDIRDKRMMLFYGGEDGYFSEPVLETLSNSLFLELKAGRAFEDIKKIPGAHSVDISRKAIAELATQNDVDYIFMTDLTRFNLVREKMVKRKKGLDFKIIVRFGIVGQLIDSKSGAVLWAENIEREDGQLNTDKRVSAEDYGPSAINSVQNGFDDMKNSIRDLGVLVK